MIINTGLRTDIVACYSDWLFKRIEAGFAYARNPLFTNKISTYDLSPDAVDAMVFCSKNYAPILPRIHEILERYRTYFFYTITPYGADVEPNVPSVKESIRTLENLARAAGKRRVVWRYDPVLLTEKYTEEFHLDAFSRMCKALAPHVSGCVFSFVEMFPRIGIQMPELIPLETEQKNRLAEKMAKIAAAHGLPLRICSVCGDYSRFGIGKRACVTLDDIGRANGCGFKQVKHEGNRFGCRCITSRDLGWYSSCPLGCRYCNANRDLAELKVNLTLHDVNSPLLIGYPGEEDTVYEPRTERLLIRDNNQISLFDL